VSNKKNADRSPSAQPPTKKKKAGDKKFGMRLLVFGMFLIMALGVIIPLVAELFKK